MEGKKDSQIAFRIEDSLARQFRVECALRGEKLTTVLIRAIKEYIARGKTEEKPEQLLIWKILS